MKKFAKIFALVLVLAMTLCVMAACGEKPSTSTPAATQGNGNKVTVTWYNGCFTHFPTLISVPFAPRNQRRG